MNIKEYIIIICYEFPIAALEILKKSFSLKGIELIDYSNDIDKAISSVKENDYISIVIRDFELPSFNGIRLLDKLSLLNPLIKGIIITSEPDVALKYSQKYIVIDKFCSDFSEKLINCSIQILNDNTKD